MFGQWLLCNHRLIGLLLSATSTIPDSCDLFRHFFAHHLAESLQISPDRIRVISTSACKHPAWHGFELV